jgi:FG-GAP-like repeat
VQITAGSFPGDGDTLTVGGATSGIVNGITFIWNPTLHALVLTGASLVANYQALLQTVAFQSTSDNPTDSNASPQRTLTWFVSDGTAVTTATTTLDITAGNDAPINTVPGAQTVAEDTILPIAGVSVADIDSSALSIASSALTTTLSVANGILNVTAGPGVTGNGTASVTIAGTAAQINTALAGLAYAGNLNFNGADTLTVATSDGTATDTDTIAITVTPVNIFEASTFELPAFGPGAGNWISDDLYPRELADVNGDGMADIVGFAQPGVLVSLATGDGHFAPSTFELPAFGPNAGGWSSDNTYPREVADVNGDGKADIVGFASTGVFVSLATGDGHFAPSTFELPAFGPNAGGWSSDDTYQRELADVNGDGKADIVGFASTGVFVSLATGDGHFAPSTFELPAFGPNAGGWSSDDTYPRELADVNGDGKADIVGFASTGVVVSLATGDGHFAAPTFELLAFGPNAGGWSSDDTYPREVADVNGDGKADIVGFASTGVFVSLATGDGHFAPPIFDLPAFGPDAGGWSSDDTYPRELADVNGGEGRHRRIRLDWSRCLSRQRIFPLIVVRTLR